MRRNLLILSLFIHCLSTVEAQYISEVLEYKPAPGQFINTTPWGYPAGASSIAGDVNGALSLGAFGGYVVFRFEQPVENHPDNPYGVDFSIFGNPTAGWSEPGIVWVMKDENENGLPDDVWYQLAGSDYYFSTTVQNYEVTYTNPGDTVAVAVPWSDNLGNSGTIKPNGINNQSYYPRSDSFPAILSEGYTLRGVLIEILVDTTKPTVMNSVQRAFGYADNQYRGTGPYTNPDNPYTREVEHSGGDGFDINWAVDTLGNYVDLDSIHFVKVQNGAMAHGAWLGEISTEITGAVDVTPDASVTGEREIIVIKDLPPEIRTSEYQLEIFVFDQGRLQSGRSIQWSLDMNEATVDEDHRLMVSRSGALTLTASLEDRPGIRTTVSTTINLGSTHSTISLPGTSEIRIYPNPARDFIRIKGINNAKISIHEASGKFCLQNHFFGDSDPIYIGNLPAGLYLVRIDRGTQLHWYKLVKQ